MGNRTALFSRHQPGGVFTIDDIKEHPGNIWFVDSGQTTTGADAAGYGKNPDAPFLTLDYAIGQCTANSGDVIYVLPGHAETVTTAITCDVAGVSIIGLGNGLDRPQFTAGANNIDAITITADGVTLENLYFNEATVASANANINIGAANAVVRRVHMDMGANDRDGHTITTDGERPIIEDCTCTVTANGPDTWVTFEGVVDMPIIRDNTVIASDGTNAFDDHILDFGGLAITNPVVVDNVFDGADVAVNAIDDAASCVGDCFAGNRYAGSAVDGDTVTVSTATLADGGITAAKFAADAIDANALAASALAEIEAEVEDAIELDNLDHLLKAAVVSNADMTAEVTNGTVLSNVLSKTSTTSTYSPTTDSLEMLSDKLGGMSGDGGAAQDDSVKASLDLLHTDVDAILADTGTDGVKVADGAITNATFGLNAIGAGVIANGTIDEAAIASAAITADKFANDAIAAAKIATGAFTADAFAADALVAATFATDSITADALAADAVAEVADGVADEPLAGHVTAATVGAMLQTPHSGAAQAGAADSVTLAAGASATNDLYNGALVQIISGTGAGQTRLITDYDGTSKAATVAPNWATNPAAADVYVIHPQGSVGGFSTDALAAIEGEAEDALEAENLDHLAAVAVVINADMTAEVEDGSVLSNIMTKDGDTSDYVPGTDSLEAIGENLVTVLTAQERCIEKSDGAVLNGDDDLFVIAGGPILVTEFVGIVTTEIGANAVNCTIQEAVTEPAGDVALSTTVAITADPAGTSYTFTAVNPGVLTETTAGAIAGVPRLGWVCPIGTIQALCTAANTGNIKWYMVYKPLSPDSVVTVAT